MDEQLQAKSPPSDALLRLIFESATDFAIFTMDPNGVTTSWNIGAERLLGYREEEIIGQLADIIFTPEDGLDAAARERETARALGRAEDERWQTRKDGSRFFASGLMMPLEDSRLTQGPAIRLRWEESGVSLPEPPQRRGYGLELIERALPYQLGAQSKVEFGPQGVVCEIVVRGRQDERYKSLS